MFDPTTLLVTRDPDLIAAIRTAHDGHRAPRLVLCGRPEDGQSVLRSGDVFLVVAHLTSSCESPEYGRLLRDAADHARATVVLVYDDDNVARSGRSLLGKDSRTVQFLPKDSRKLARLINQAIRRASLPCRPASPTADLSDLKAVEPEDLAQIRRVVDQTRPSC